MFVKNSTSDWWQYRCWSRFRFRIREYVGQWCRNDLRLSRSPFESYPPKPQEIKSRKWKKKRLEKSNAIHEWPERTPSANLEGMTPTALFNLFFDDDVMECIVDQTNLYANQVKNKPNFLTSVSEMKKFFAILLISGYCKLPRMHMYWENQPDVNNEAISSAMSRSRFQEILQCIHFADNSNLPSNDSFAKVRNFLAMINERCLLYFPTQQNLSIDESMIPYFGQNSCKQRMPIKPVRVGYKAGLCLHLWGSWFSLSHTRVQNHMARCSNRNTHGGFPNLSCWI